MSPCPADPPSWWRGTRNRRTASASVLGTPGSPAECRRTDRRPEPQQTARRSSSIFSGAQGSASNRGHDVTDLIDKAGTDARRAVDELWQIVHGIFPAALRGNLAGLAANMETAGLATTVDIDRPDDLPSDVQAGVYFAVSELGTNVLKRARATSVHLLCHRTEDNRIIVMVEDDGICGADSAGTGLLGAIETLDEHVQLSSPAGGPTRIALEVPCAS
ncbi:hypothetical protein RERY_24140 [Rhodococcus erythropolis]|nr:hypothetical protein RERY_24140 [Rhodococcus erythropolis]